MLRKSVDWFLYDNGLRHERVKLKNYAIFKFEKVINYFTKDIRTIYSKKKFAVVIFGGLVIELVIAFILIRQHFCYDLSVTDGRILWTLKALTKASETVSQKCS